MRKWALAGALCALASSLATARGKGDFYTFADTIVFRDSLSTPGVPGDGLHSETPGVTSTYANGVGGVVIRVVWGGSGDAVMDLNGTRPLRTIQAETTAPNLLAILGSPYATTATPCSFLNVNDVWGVAIGQTANRSVGLVHPTGALRFGQYGATSGDAYSTQALVTRVSKTFWVVTTDGTPAQAVYSTTGHGKNSGGNTAEYALPFQLTISCSKCATVN